MARFTGFLDACVIVPLAPCDTMLRMADVGADLSPSGASRIVTEQAAAMRQPPVEIAQLLGRLTRSGAPGFSQRVAEALQTNP